MPEPAEIEPEPETIEVPRPHPYKARKKTLPEELPRVELVHDIDEADKQCGCGAPLSKIGEDVCEKLDIIPAVIG
ncbi:MAG: IS66 family transposase zinc-finger binding domain-containing protein [Desulfofustis sp. PB-SRB1]|nr:IS66 family transposase zinc-finger binding domain-containing protein [Desulfofustis sp. PB-SRB1]